MKHLGEHVYGWANREKHGRRIFLHVWGFALAFEFSWRWRGFIATTG